MVKIKQSIGWMLLGLFSGAGAQSVGVNHPATDDLGRGLPAYEDVGDVRTNKVVAMFYWTWHAGHSTRNKAYDLSKIMTDPAMVNDYDHPLWAPYADQATFFWSEPLFGFYDGLDKWVIRKQLEMLGAAGVDVLFYDATNGKSTWEGGYEAVGQVMAEARADGVTVPQFAFMLNFSPQETTALALVQLYDELYSPGLYQDSWFLWDGKPAIMAYPEALDNPPLPDTAGLKFTAASAFSGISARCPSWGNNLGDLTLSLYAWAGSYSTSVSQAPLAGQTFVDFNDNAYLALEFSSLPAGDYVWELTGARETVGVWKYTDDTASTDSYFNGAAVAGDYMSRIKVASAGVYSDLVSGSSTTPVPLDAGVGEEKAAAIQAFFTFRPGQPAYEGGPTRNDQWGWLENAPQNGYVEKTPGDYEFMTVGVAQNWSEQTHALSAMNGPQIHGRSYTDADGFSRLTTNSYLYGCNFQEQWDRALEVDPDIVFITGWNEWVMGRFETWQGVENAFPDQFDAEHSRDIEPMKGGFGDNYYYQMIANIRKFKGMEKPETASARKTISIDGDFAEWADVKPDFTDSPGDAQLRDGYGYIDPDSPAGEPLHYVNSSGRNDIIGAKVARDQDFVCFQVQARDPLTSPAGANWMQLLIDADRSKATGWEGYDFRVGPYAADGTASLQVSSNAWNWAEVARVDFRVAGAELEIAIPRTFLDPPDGRLLDLEFKWLDNYNQSGDIMDFYTQGDAAPGGRFNYLYSDPGTIFQDTFEGASVWDDLNQDLPVRQAEGRAGSTYTVDGVNWRTLIDSTTDWGDTRVLLGRITASEGGGGEVAIDLDTDFGPDVLDAVWSLSFRGRILSSVGFSGWTGFSVGHPASTPGLSGTGFAFTLLRDGTYAIWNNGSTVGSGALGFSIAARIYDLTATFDEVANSVALSYADAATNVNLGTYSTGFTDDHRFVELKNHVDSSSGDGIVDMRWDNLTITILSVSEASFYEKWAQENGLGELNSICSADPDLDGMDNLLEYALGGDPSFFDAADVMPISNFSADRFRYVYTRRRDAVARGLSYNLAYKFDLLDPDWNDVGSALEVATNYVDRYYESVSNEFMLTGLASSFFLLKVGEK